MIHALDKTIRELLREEVQSVMDGQVEVSFQQPTRDWSSREGNKPTINLYLYDVRENPHLRTHQWETILNGQNGVPRADNSITQKRTPMRVDCFYMLTTWATDPNDEHHLLSEAMMALFSHPVLPEDALQNGLQTSQPFEIRTRLASHDILTNPAELWGALDNNIRPTISYVVTLSLDPWTAITGPAVQTFSITTGQEAKPAQLRKRRLRDEGKGQTLSYIGGVVFAKGEKEEVHANIEVRIEETGLFTKTDHEGKFRFYGLTPGDYKLIARLPTGDSTPHDITIPDPDTISDPEDDSARTAAKGKTYNLEV